MNNEENSQNKTERKYDLEERTAKFGEDVIKFCINLSKSEI